MTYKNLCYIFLIITFILKKMMKFCLLIILLAFDKAFSFEYRNLSLSEIKDFFSSSEYIVLEFYKDNCQQSELINKLLVQVSGLTVGKKYTVFTSAINDSNVEHTIFPESYSFVAKSKESTLSFYYQFIFD